MSAKKLATVLTIRNDEIQKRAWPLREAVKRDPLDNWWFVIAITAFLLGCFVGQVAALVPLGE
jgi:hypothetical protein